MSANSPESGEPELPLVPVRTPPRGAAVPPASLTPAARWLAERQVRVLCLIIAGLSPFVALALLVRAITALRSTLWVYSVDGVGTIHYGPVKQADADNAVFREILLQAAQAYFTRNPGGLSYPELARRLFVGESWRALQSEVGAELPERSRRNLFDHPEVEGIDILDRGAVSRYRIRGFLVRSGAVDGLPYQPPPGEFHLIVELSPQKDALQMGRYPFVVTRHRTSVRWSETPGS